MEPLHKLSSAIIYAFLVLHMANHYAGLVDAETHIQVMGVLRLIYRHPIVESVLFLAFVIQIITGISLVREIWTKKKDFIHQLQAASGLVITAFVLIHVAHMLFGRMIERTDTNFYYVAAGFMSPPKSYVMMTIYGFGLMALFLHFGCVGYSLFKKVNKSVGYAILAFVLMIGGASTYYLISMLTGDLYPLHIPEEYSGIVTPEASSEAISESASPGQ
jgi:hypothetical protein